MAEIKLIPNAFLKINNTAAVIGIFWKNELNIGDTLTDGVNQYKILGINTHFLTKPIKASIYVDNNIKPIGEKLYTINI